MILGVILAIITSWVVAVVGVVVRKLRNIHYAHILFYYGALSVVIFSSYLLYDGKYTIVSYSYKQYLLLLLVTILNTVSKNFETLAFQTEKSSFISLIGYSYVIYAFILDIFYFNIEL